MRGEEPTVFKTHSRKQLGEQTKPKPTHQLKVAATAPICNSLWICDIATVVVGKVVCVCFFCLSFRWLCLLYSIHSRSIFFIVLCAFIAAESYFYIYSHTQSRKFTA